MGASFLSLYLLHFFIDKHTSGSQRTVETLSRQYATQIADNERQLEKIVGFKSTLYENMVQGIISKADFASLNAEYLSDITRLTAAIEKLRVEREDVLAGTSERTKWTEHFRRFENLTEIDRRAVVNLIQSIRVTGKSELQITYNYQSEFDNAIAFLEREVA